VEFGSDSAQSLFWEKINRNFFAVHINLAGRSL
jgi:hypothetical protein